MLESFFGFLVFWRARDKEIELEREREREILLSKKPLAFYEIGSSIFVDGSVAYQIESFLTELLYLGANWTSF